MSLFSPYLFHLPSLTSTTFLQMVVDNTTDNMAGGSGLPEGWRLWNKEVLERKAGEGGEEKAGGSGNEAWESLTSKGGKGKVGVADDGGYDGGENEEGDVGKVGEDIGEVGEDIGEVKE